jgi:four helix bundle protein
VEWHAFPSWTTRVGLRSQLLRAAASIAANIPEGAGQQSQARFARFLEIAISSTHELDNHIELAQSLEMIDSRQADGAARADLGGGADADGSSSIQLTVDSYGSDAAAYH